VRIEIERTTQELAAAEARLRAATGLRERLEAELVPLVDQQIADTRRQAELGRLDVLLLLDGLSRAHDTELRVLDARLDEIRATVELDSFFWPDLTLPNIVEDRS
jgi:hypothetical protein